jgi:pimeloyl-ACP methyl ester carboxylesterase
MGKNAVALIPGFLGHSRIFRAVRDTSYFSDRFTAGLSGVMTGHGLAEVPIFPIAALPIGSLAARQDALVAQLDAIDRLRGPFDWHLIGHGIGGLDAALLARTQRLHHDGKRSSFSLAVLRQERVRSVTTLAAPHYGTGLALAPLPAMTSGGRVSRQAIFDLVDAARDALSGRDEPGRRLAFALATAFEGNALGFVYPLLRSEALAADLDPRVCTSLTETPNRRDVPIFSIAAMAPWPTPTPPDRLFGALWGWTAQGAAALPPPPHRGRHPDAVVAANRFDLPANLAEIPSEDNDGVVNTARQVDPRGRYAALVLGDHGDVIGGYQRRDVHGHVVEPGMLTSEARFRDEQFARLLAVIGKGVAETLAKKARAFPTIAVGGSPQRSPLRQIHAKGPQRG